MPKHEKILFVDAQIEDSFQWGLEALRKTIPNGEIVVFDPGDARSLWTRWRKLRQSSSAGYKFSVLPAKNEFLAMPSYWRSLILFLAGWVGSPMLVSQYGTMASPQSLILQRLMPLHPLISLMIIFRLPYYILRQFGKFMNSVENPGEEFVGFGRGKDVGGLVYWLTLTRKASLYGLFGLDPNTYMGWPISVHSWPLAILALKKLGYRKYTYLAAGLLGLGMAWLCVSSGHLWMLWMIPLILFSTYFIFSIYVSTWEILAWGFGFVAWAALNAHMPALSGCFLGAVILTHPGVGSLVGLSLVLYAMIDSCPIGDLILLFTVTCGLVIWWVVPYLRSRDKLGRAYVMNKLWLVSKRWHPTTLYQFLIYSAFFVAALWAGSFVETHVWLLALPLLVLYYNVKISFSFSRYTICNYMLFVGGTYLCLHASLLPFLVFLLVINTSGNLLFGADCLWGFDLTPVVLGRKRQEIIRFFSDFPSGRVALEMGGTGAQPAWSIIGALGYILADSDIDILNVGYTEVGDHNIYEKYCQHFNAQASREDFETACQESGVKYMIALTDEFCEVLRRRGYREVSALSDVSLSETPAPVKVSLRLTAFELPWESYTVWPKTEIQVLKNQIRFRGNAGVSYRLKYSAFKGWRAFQNGKSLKIIDAMPGILVCSESDNQILLKYSYFHYWLF